MKELEPIKKIIRAGLDVAKGYDASSIRPVHLFMGIIKHGNNGSCELLLNLGLDLDTIANLVEELLHINEIESSFTSIVPFTTEAQMVLDNVNSERLLLKDKEVNYRVISGLRITNVIEINYINFSKILDINFLSSTKSLWYLSSLSFIFFSKLHFLRELIVYSVE